MICLKDIGDDHLYSIAEHFAVSFLAEEGIVSSSLDHEDAVQYFYVTLREFVKYGCLYAGSENEEGYIVFYRKGHGLPWYKDLVLTFLYFLRMSYAGVQKMIQSRIGWTDYTVYFGEQRDYVDICLVCVRKEYQHQGWLKELLKEPFRMADENGIPAILDTDAEVKMQKYCHEGMRIAKDELLKSGIHMYTLIHDPKEI